MRHLTPQELSKDARDALLTDVQDMIVAELDATDTPPREHTLYVDQWWYDMLDYHLREIDRVDADVPADATLTIAGVPVESGNVVAGPVVTEQSEVEA